MNSLLNSEFLFQKLNELKDWVYLNILIWDNLIQIALQIIVLLAVRLIDALIGRWFRNFIKNKLQNRTLKLQYLANFLTRLLRLSPLIFSIFILGISIQVLNQIGYHTILMSIVLNLSMAWVVIRSAASIILDRFWSRLIATLAWSLAALNIIGILDETISILESIGFQFGEVQLTLLSIIKATGILIILIKSVNWFSTYLEKKLLTVPEIMPLHA